MSMFFCYGCQCVEDSDSEGYIAYKDQEYCDAAFCEEFDQCYDCNGFKNKFIVAIYDGHYCDCD